MLYIISASVGVTIGRRVGVIIIIFCTLARRIEYTAWHVSYYVRRASHYFVRRASCLYVCRVGVSNIRRVSRPV